MVNRLDGLAHSGNRHASCIDVGLKQRHANRDIADHSAYAFELIGDAAAVGYQFVDVVRGLETFCHRLEAWRLHRGTA